MKLYKRLDWCEGGTVLFAATVIVTVALALMMATAAARKLSHSASVVDSYRRAGVPERMLNPLAIILVAGAAGLLVGVWWAPVGIAAAVGTIAYFVGAISFHVRNDDLGRLPTPAAYLAMAAASLVLQIASL
jgi:hypothetical protein